MVSRQTVIDIYAVLERHIPDHDRRAAVLAGLAQVRGNQSFTDTARALLRHHSGLMGIAAIVAAAPSPDEPPTRREGTGSEPPGKKEAVPPEHLQYVVKVHRAAADGKHTAVAITRTFDNATRAEDFYKRTINVHQAKANNGEAPAYDVELATQDRRDHRKDRQYTVQKHQLVVGRAYQCKPTG